MVMVASARAAEGRRTRGLASRWWELVVIGSFRGRCDGPGGDVRAGSGLWTGAVCRRLAAR